MIFKKTIKSYFRPAEKIARQLLHGLLYKLYGNKPAALPLQTDTCRKILICRYDRAGDMIVTTPVIHLLHQMIPNVQIHVLASPRNSSLLRYDRRVAKVYELDGTQEPLQIFLSLFKGNLRHQMREERYDAVFCFVFHKTTLAGLVASILTGSESVKIGITHPDPRRMELYYTLFNVLLETEFERETMAELLVRFVCKPFGWKYSPDLVEYGVELADTHYQYAESVLQMLPKNNTENGGQKLVFYNCSAGKLICEWSFERNHACLTLLTKRFPDVHFCINTAPQDRARGEALHALFPKATTLLPLSNDLLDICALVQRMDAVFTPDTSIVHIATMYRKPLVALYSRSLYAVEWFPFGDFPRKILISEGQEPVESITPEQASEAFAEII